MIIRKRKIRIMIVVVKMITITTIRIIMVMIGNKIGSLPFTSPYLHDIRFLIYASLGSLHTDRHTR